MKNYWKKISSKIVHKNPWYYIRQDKVIRPDGQKGTYSVMVAVPAVWIIAMNSRKEICVVNLYRYTTRMQSIEIPAGGSDGQKPLIAAKRELMEETGIVAKKWKLVGKFQIGNGLMDHLGYAFLATNLTLGKSHRQMEEGISSHKFMSIKSILQLIKAGKISDSESITALMSALLELNVKLT